MRTLDTAQMKNEKEKKRSKWATPDRRTRNGQGKERNGRGEEKKGIHKQDRLSQALHHLTWIADGKLRDHSCGSGPHEVLASLLGQSTPLSLLVVKIVTLLTVLVIIFDDTGRNLARAVLLT